MKIFKPISLILLIYIFLYITSDKTKSNKIIIHIPLNEELIELKKDGTYVSKSILERKSPFDTIYVERGDIQYIFIEEKLNWKDSVDRGYFQGE